MPSAGAVRVAAARAVTVAGASITSVTGLRAAEASATGGWSSPQEAAVVAVRTATAVRAMSRRGRVVLAGRGEVGAAHPSIVRRTVAPPPPARQAAVARTYATHSSCNVDHCSPNACSAAASGALRSCTTALKKASSRSGPKRSTRCRTAR